MTKKNILLSSFIIVITLLISNYIGNVRLCAGEYNCIDLLFTIEIIFLPIFPLFFFSLITYFMREEIFRPWIRFAMWWVPISMFLILITPNNNGGGFGPQLSFGGGDTAVLASGIFVLISLAIVIYGIFKIYIAPRGRSLRYAGIFFMTILALIVFALLYWLFHGLFWPTMCGPLEGTLRSLDLSIFCG